MVSLKTELFKKYIQSRTNSSLLLKCFCLSLFDPYFILSNEEITRLKENKRDYKNIAAQGFYLKKDSEVIPTFCEGLKWLMGRQLANDSPIITDNIPLLGFIVGLKQITNAEFIKSIKAWLHRILDLKNKHSNQHEYTTFFNKLLEAKTNELSDNNLKLELNIFNFFLQNQTPKPNDFLVNYYARIRVKCFPYFENNFFRNVINIYNENQILNSYILNQEQFEKRINSAKEEEAIHVLKPIKKVLSKRAKNFADKVFFIYIITVLVAILFVFVYVLKGDWDFLEPRTYLLGIPLLPYFFNAVYFWITNKELSLKPKDLLEKIRNWRLKRLNDIYSISNKH